MKDKIVLTLAESQTRIQFIDQQLGLAGWTTTDHRRKRLESVLEVVNGDSISLFADFVLFGSDRKPLAIVESKQTSQSNLLGQPQAVKYANKIHQEFGMTPFVFLTDGLEIWFWEQERYSPRKVSGFLSRDDLERLLHQRQYGLPLKNTDLNLNIVNRNYQHEAIQRVIERIEQAQRRFLLVMATGTGKTRTVIAMVDLLLRAQQAQRILFLADRRELVRQAMAEFKTFLPNESLVRLEGGITSSARIQFATYPSMMGIYERLSVGYYDFIIADESHRSIYQHYQAIFEHFDAKKLGLTATPTDYIDHNTFQMFDCADGIPTYYYGYEQAIKDQNLVHYRVLDAQKNFRIQDTEENPLTPPLQQIAEEHLEVIEVNFEGSEIEHGVIDTNTNDSMVREFMDRCRKDARGLPHKSIIFAVSHAHASRLLESFNQLYPEWQQHGLAEIIDSYIERAEAILDDFKYKNMPRVAISVNMLDTGVDVPAIQNLMFAKPVFSHVKFWQMIGRGTRKYHDPNTFETKKDFLILDYWQNFAHFKLEPEAETNHTTEPLPVRLFRLRLEKWLLLTAQNQDVSMTVSELQTMIAALPRNNVNVRPYLQEIDLLLTQWSEPLSETQTHLSSAIAPLMRFVVLWSLEELQFRVTCERLSVAWLQNDQAEQTKLHTSILEAINGLADTIPEVKQSNKERVQLQAREFWQHLNLERLHTIQNTFAPLMQYRLRKPSTVIELNKRDKITSRAWVMFGPTGEGTFAESYRKQVEAFIRRQANELPTLAKMKRGETLTGSDLQNIADTLNQADLFITEETLQQAYDTRSSDFSAILHHILNENTPLETFQTRTHTAFEQFITEHGTLRANQINFLRAIKAAVQRRSRINHAILNEPPLSRVGRVETLFTALEIEEIIEFSNKLLHQTV